MDEIFYELIRVSIGSLAKLSRTPSESEWTKLFNVAEKQSLFGICFIGLQRLGADANDGFAGIGMSEDLYLEWMGLAAQICQRNEIADRQCIELQELLADKGIRSSILKGQGIACLYGDHLRGFRQSGDIDVYVDCGRNKAIEYARSIQDNVDWDYKHLHLNMFDDTEVEMHYVPEIFLNIRKNRKLQRWFAGHQEEMFFQNGSFVTPNISFNLFYILLHSYRHFLYEGVGLRQLTDYYFVLKSPAVTSEMRDETISTVVLFGMKRFTSGLMWILQNVFGLESDRLLCEPDEKEGRFILKEVSEGGNFGYHDNRLNGSPDGKFGTIVKILKHNFSLFIHYPDEALWAPVWILYHWCWKRAHK